MRGAATAAQQRMANLGRSETPEATILHHHETRTSARRFGGRDAREESVEIPQMIVKLKIGKERFRKFIRDLKTGNKPSNLQQTPSFNRAQSGLGTPSQTPAHGAMGPPLTPGVTNQTLQASTTPVPQGQIGRIDAPPPPPPGQPPHVPVRSPISLQNFSIHAQGSLHNKNWYSDQYPVPLHIISGFPFLAIPFPPC
jgi:SWI/SNF-related matrix-associated actin-dependent regulator of chromatin subfamily B protein 1